jgi:hypothetical protein
MTTWEKNRLSGSALRVEAIGRATRIALALVLFAAAPRAQNLSGALTSGTFSTATNCAATNPPSGCVSATLTQGTNVSIQAGQTVLGPGFDAKASSTSTSLVIGPLPPAVTSVTPASGSGPRSRSRLRHRAAIGPARARFSFWPTGPWMATRPATRFITRAVIRCTC